MTLDSAQMTWRSPRRERRRSAGKWQLWLTFPANLTFAKYSPDAIKIVTKNVVTTQIILVRETSNKRNLNSEDAVAIAAMLAQANFTCHGMTVLEKNIFGFQDLSDTIKVNYNRLINWCKFSYVTKVAFWVAQCCKCVSLDTQAASIFAFEQFLFRWFGSLFHVLQKINTHLEQFDCTKTVVVRIGNIAQLH